LVNACEAAPQGGRCAGRDFGPVLYVRSSAQVVHVQYVFDTVYGTYRYIYFELIFIENRCNPFDAILLSPKFPLVDSPATRHTWRPRGVPRAYACSSGSDRWVPSSVTPGARPCRPVCSVYAKTPNSLSPHRSTLLHCRRPSSRPPTPYLRETTRPRRRVPCSPILAESSLLIFCAIPELAVSSGSVIPCMPESLPESLNE